MNKIVICLLFAGLALAGCHEVTVGYMKTEHAAYQIDSLHIYDTVGIQKEITRLESASISLADSLKFAMDSLKNYAYEMNNEYTFRWATELHPLDLQLNELLKDSIHHVADIITLKKQIAEIEAEINVLYDLSEELMDQVYEIKLRLDALDPSEGQADVSSLEKLKEYRLRVANRISWTTSEIEGVDGTAPIFYSIADVWAEKGGNADIFRSEIVIKGGGRMTMPYDFKSPAGYYHLSITISNEGYSRTLKDVFTFIIN